MDADTVSEQPDASRRRRSILRPAAAAATVVVAVSVATAIRSSDAHAPKHPVAASESGSTAPPTDPHYRTAVVRIEAALTALDLPPSARRTSQAPATALRTGAYGPLASPELIRRTAFWTARETPAQVLRFVRAHVPRGFEFSGTFSSGSPADPAVNGISFDKAGDSVLAQPDLEVTVVRVGSGAAVRADSLGIWLRSRSPASKIVDPTGVDVVVTRKGRDLLRHLGVHDARTLAALVNALPTATDALTSCPGSIGLPSRDTLRFAVAGATRTVDDDVVGCGTVRVDREPYALDPGMLDTVLLHLLGITER